MFARTSAACLLIAAVLSGCAGDDDADADVDDPIDDGPRPLQASDATVKASEHPSLGTIVTDPDGMTLYVFTQDEAQTSNCSGGCAENWPPLEAHGGTLLAVGAPGFLQTIHRDDGTDQVTYDGQPLYYFASDDEPGDASGQGLNDVWFVIKL